ncbi:MULTISPECIES: glycosyltransferase [unclassified Cellulophaga]|uniref:glycosyltransferase n=1 Tax=unclassified Cellulophaga TaxID=2634405 RepID=UPI001C4FE73D|nr:glycosyltransferase [Cellulophaga sp. HaHa_2_1]QXP52440.1 glycosyltransferase [Cellulophaga sp. HaHa_2_1]
MKIKVLFILPSLRAGGAERVMSFISQSIDKNKFSPTLLIIENESESVYEIEGIPCVYLSKKRTLNAFGSIFSFLKKEKPDVVLSTLAHVNTMMAIQSIWFRKIKFIGREANVLSVLGKIQKNNSLLHKVFSAKRFYNLLNILICQSEDMKKDMITNYNLKPENITVINNPISDKFNLKEKNNIYEIPNFITVGALEKRKGHERILESLSMLDFNFRYTIIGKGSEKENIKLKAAKLGLSNKIKFIPFSNDINTHLHKSNLFLLGSFVEGFPNALIEAIATGTKAIVFNCPGGINEILEPGINGYIAESNEEYSRYIKKALNENSDPKAIAKGVRERYDRDKILKLYENLFLKLNEK